MILFIAFDEKDVAEFSEIQKPEDAILAYSDIYTKNCIDVVNLVALDEADIVSAIRLFFEQESLEFPIQNFRGFANNFWECTVRPLVRYIASIKSYINNYSIERVVFSKFVNGSGGPSYYMGEHEAQGDFLYDRKFAFQPIITSWLEKQGVKPVFLSSKSSVMNLRYFARDAAVFLFKVLQGVKASFPEKISEVNTEAEVIIVVRSMSQLEFFSPMISSSNLKIQVFIGRALKDSALLSTALENSAEWRHVTFSQLPRSSLFSVLRKYLIGAFKYFRAGNGNNLELWGVELNVSQSKREIFIMSLEVDLYSDSLAKALVPFKRSDAVFITGEQKSPHAFIDASRSRENNLKCVQFMTCDQEASDLPYPVFGDVFFVDLKAREVAFRRKWSTNTDKIRYIGCVKNLNRNISVGKEITSSKYKYCYFSHASEPTYNLSVLNILLESAAQNGFKFCIKLHPRDNGRWANNVGLKFKVIKHGDPSFNFVDSFEVAVTNPSGVVLDLICSLKPVIILDILTSYKNLSLPYMNLDVNVYVFSLEELKSKLKNDAFDSKTDILHKELFGDEGIRPSLADLLL